MAIAPSSTTAFSSLLHRDQNILFGAASSNRPANRIDAQNGSGSRPVHLGEHSHVLDQRPHRRVAGPCHQHWRPGTFLGIVGQHRVPELVQRRPAGGLGEQGKLARSGHDLVAILLNLKVHLLTSEQPGE